MVNKIMSIMMSVFIMLQTFFPAMLGAKYTETLDPEALTSPADYINYIQQNGLPSLDTATFFSALTPVNILRRIYSGKIFYPADESFIDVTLDDQIAQMTDYIMENTGLDVEGILTHMPRYGTPIGDLLVESVGVDTSAARAVIYAVGDKAREKGYTAIASAIYLFAMFFTVADSMTIYGVPNPDNPDEIIVLMDVTYRDGTTETIDPDIIINTVTGHAYNVNGTGISGTGFEMDIYELTLYTITKSWQRKYGYSVIYDVVADLNPAFNYVTRRFVFQYGDKEWLIQIWKGNYATITNGGEIGLYYKDPADEGTFYSCVADEDFLTLQMDVYHGDELLVSKGPETTWWMTAFKVSSTIYLPQTLTMQFSITFKEPMMEREFLRAVRDNAAQDVTCTVDGLTVHGVW